MNFLTGIRPNLLPDLNNLSLEKLGAGAPSAGKAIPLAELQSLGVNAPGLDKPMALPDLGRLAPPIGSPAGTQSPANTESFSSLLGQFVGEVNAKSQVAGQAVGGLLAGQNVSLHQAVIAMEEAGVSFQLMVEVRNKLLEAYQELMRMQV
jgi:flagellar hook-basal body complex protein FliE